MQYKNGKLNHEYLNGTWKATPEFAEECEIADMYVNFTLPRGLIIIITTDDKIIESKFDISFRDSAFKLNNTDNTLYAKITHDEAEIFPEYVKIDLDITSGFVSIFSDKTYFEGNKFGR